MRHRAGEAPPRAGPRARGEARAAGSLAPSSLGLPLPQGPGPMERRGERARAEGSPPASPPRGGSPSLVTGRSGSPVLGQVEAMGAGELGRGRCGGRGAAPSGCGGALTIPNAPRVQSPRSHTTEMKATTESNGAREQRSVQGARIRESVRCTRLYGGSVTRRVVSPTLTGLSGIGVVVRYGGDSWGYVGVLLIVMGWNRLGVLLVGMLLSVRGFRMVRTVQVARCSALASCCRS